MDYAKMFDTKEYERVHAESAAAAPSLDHYISLKENGVPLKTQLSTRPFAHL